MAVSLKIRGHLRDPRLVNELVHEVTDYAEALGWTWFPITDSAISGMFVHAHKDVTSMALLFDEDGVLLNHFVRGRFCSDLVVVETHRAPVDIHIALCSLLRHLQQNYFDDLEVDDDGGYWDSNDPSILEARRERARPPLDGLADDKALGTLPQHAATKGGSPGQAERAEGSSAVEIGIPIDELKKHVDGLLSPYCYRDVDEWDLQKWCLFWQNWDEYFNPSLAVMRVLPESLETAALAVEIEWDVDKRKTAERTFVNMWEELHSTPAEDPASAITDAGSPAATPGTAADASGTPSALQGYGSIDEHWYDAIDDDDFDADDCDGDPSMFDEAEDEDYDPIEFLDDMDLPWEDYFVDVKLGSGAFDIAPEVFLMASDWYDRMTDLPYHRKEAPASSFIIKSLYMTAYSVRTAYSWWDDWEFALSVPSRLQVCEQRFRLYARLLRLEPASPLEDMACEADAIADRCLALSQTWT